MDREPNINEKQRYCRAKYMLITEESLFAPEYAHEPLWSGTMRKTAEGSTSQICINIGK